MGQQNVIEINDKQYDAVSGALLSEKLIKVTPSHTGQSLKKGHNIDGFLRKSSPATLKAPGQNNPAHIVRHATNPHHVQAHKPQHTDTLMRKLVKKPKPDLKPAIKVTAPAEIMASPVNDLANRSEKSSP